LSKRSRSRPRKQPAAPLAAWKKILYRALPTLILLAVPLLGETVMKAADKGIDTHPFLAPPHAPGLLRDNLDFPFKYHPVSRHSRQDVYKNLFNRVKAPGTLRGVVLGGSTAEGFPYNSRHGFSGILEEAVAAATGREVEVLNLGFSAMSSYYVRDVARKIADLDVDFAVIYTGHNEYYGTISYSSGANHLAKLVNMRLKDHRIFQGLYGLLAPDQGEGGPTLMTRQYAQTRFPPEAERDRQVRERFLDNLDEAVGRLAGRGTTVLVVEPVSNLVDMPPFVGGDDPGVDPAVVALGRKVLAGGPNGTAASRAWLADAELNAGARTDPLAAYARARALLQTGAFDPDLFVLAKDLDPAPFRAPSHLVQALADWAGQDPRVAYVPLTDRLRQARGPGALSHQLFIDHLHLNHDGQVVTASIIAESLAAAMPSAGIDTDRLSAWFEDRKAVDASVGFLGVFDLLASRRVAALVAGPPYEGMAFPYRSPGSSAGLDQEVLQEAGLRGRLLQAPEGDMLMVYGGHVIQNGDAAAVRRLLAAFDGINPGSPNTHMAAGNYLALLGGAQDDRAALLAYDKVLQLAEDPARRRGAIKSFLIGKGRADLAAQIR
jgi:hypothetical protein